MIVAASSPPRASGSLHPRRPLCPPMPGPTPKRGDGIGWWPTMRPSRPAHAPGTTKSQRRKTDAVDPGLSGAFEMPKRTTPKQEVIALLRRLLAKEGCAITESAMLQDARTDLQREVDVVMECDIGDVQVTVSFEVVDHKRKADILWVEQMLKKHE